MLSGTAWDGPCWQALVGFVLRAAGYALVWGADVVQGAAWPPGSRPVERTVLAGSARIQIQAGVYRCLGSLIE